MFNIPKIFGQPGKSHEDSEARQEAINDEDSNDVNANSVEIDAEDEEEEKEETGCCGRTTCCNAKLRDISVNEPVSACISGTVTWSTIFRLVTCLVLVTIAWATLYFLIGEEMLAGGAGCGLFLIVLASYILGWSLAYIPYLQLPPVFGMLLAGMILRNTGIYDVQEKIGHLPIAKIRTFCLTFVTLRAGLQLTTTPLIRYPFFILILAVLPCTLEMLTVALCSHYILNYPWDWAFLTGSIIACMSPVVTVNCMLALADRGYGEDKGMATLLCTASSIDDVHIVSLYSICFSVVFSVDSKSTAWWTYIPGGLRDLLLGVVTGTLLGLLFVFFPHRAAKYVSLYRLASLILGALMCTTAASTIAITGGGYLATIVMAFIATTGWRVIDVNFDVTSMRRVIFFAWHFMQPVLVGVIGADINFANWSWNKFGLYVVCILVGLLARSAVCIMSTYRTNFNTKERVFVALAWLSKGTLQAALAPMTYENAKLENDPVKVEIALDVMRISVVSIIFLAPLGAVIMMVSGPLLLNRTAEEETTRERHLSHLRKTNQLQPILSRQGNEKGRRGRSEAS